MSNRRKLKLASLNGHTVVSRAHIPGDASVRDSEPPGPGAINAYVCSTCYRLTVVEHVDRGVTPMYMSCLATEGCVGTARSMRYPPNPPQKVKDAVRWEWYKPDDEEFKLLDPEMKLFVNRGGLCLRQKEK